MDSTFSKGCRSVNNNVDSQSAVNHSCPGFVTPVVGDVGTCKTNHAAMSRSCSFRWVGLCPGDFVRLYSKLMVHLVSTTSCLP